jgi:hypothetical protein
MFLEVSLPYVLTPDIMAPSAPLSQQPVDARLISVVIYRGRDVPCALTPSQLAETVLYTIVPPPLNEGQLTQMTHHNGDMAVLQVPLPSYATSPPQATSPLDGPMPSSSSSPPLLEPPPPPCASPVPQGLFIPTHVYHRLCV